MSGALKELREQGRAAHKAGDLDTAKEAYIRYLAEVPGDAGIWSNLGVLFRRQSEHDLAIRAHRRARSLRPDDLGLMNNEANVLNDMGRHAESLARRETILAAEPGNLNQMAMIGKSLRSLGRYAESVARLQTYHDAHPADFEIELQLALSLLASGEFEAGFRHYDARWRSGELKDPGIDLPKWRPGDDLTGKTVLVLPEQGFGDAVLFTRFLPWVKSRGGAAHVLYRSERPLSRLFQQLEGVDWVGQTLPSAHTPDCYLTVMDLPLLGLTGPEDIPPPSRLAIPPDSTAGAEAIVEPYRDAFRVGVIWSGSETFKGNDFRSFSHRQFLPLTDIDGVQLFSLYKGPRTEALHADGSSAFILDVGSSDRDFADCAANMRAMDLVITSDTATAHVAGSLGVPTWCVLHWDPFWFFGHTGDRTPWYPSMRLFRQSRPRDWDGVFEEVRAALEARVAGRRSGT